MAHDTKVRLLFPWRQVVPGGRHGSAKAASGVEAGRERLGWQDLASFPNGASGPLGVKSDMKAGTRASPGSLVNWGSRSLSLWTIPQLTISPPPPVHLATVTPQRTVTNENVTFVQKWGQRREVSKFPRHKRDTSRCGDLRTHSQVEMVRKQEKPDRMGRPLKRGSSCPIHGRPWG